MLSSEISYSIELWENCSTGCPICYHTSGNRMKPNFALSKDGMLSAVEELKKLIDSVNEDEKVDIFLYGGELLEYNAFNERGLGEFLSQKMEDTILNLKISSGFVTTNMEYVDDFLSKFKPDQYEYITFLTSWDPVGLRFRNPEEEEIFFERLEHLRDKYKGIKFQVNITLTNTFCRSVVKGEVDLDRIFDNSDWPLSFTIYHEGDFKYSPTLTEIVKCLEHINYNYSWGRSIIGHFVETAGCCGGEHDHRLYMYDKNKGELTPRDNVPYEEYLPKLPCGHFDFNKWVLDYDGKCIYCELNKIYSNTIMF